MKTVYGLAIIFSLVGISATFMPWLHYPRNNTVFYGYLADGLITGLVFLLALIFSIYYFRKGKTNKTLSTLFAGAGLLMAYLSYYKIRTIELEKVNFYTEDPLKAGASAGFHQGIGVYVFGLAGFCLFMTLLYSLVALKPGAITVPATNPRISLVNYIFPIITLIVIVSVLFKATQTNKNISLQNKDVRATIKKNIDQMGSALVQGDYKKFIAHTHPSMIQGYGGEARVIELLEKTMETLKTSGSSIKAVTLQDILDIQESKDNIQVLCSQKVTYLKQGKEINENQKQIAISEDGGSSWKFVNIDGKKKAELTKFFPLLNQKLNF